MKRIWRNFCCCPSKQRTSLPRINILILGLSRSGKTEVGHILTARNRIDFSSTNGARTYSRRLGPYQGNLIEIGGSSDMQNIWRHYYAHARAIIYVFDTASPETLIRAWTILTDVIKHQYVQGKPFLVLANKSDLHRIDISRVLYADITIERLANFFRSHIKVASCGRNDYVDLFTGIEWLQNQIQTEWKSLTNRIKFDVETERLRFGSDSFQSSGENTSVNQARNNMHRPRSAPTARTSRKSKKIRKNRVHSKTAVDRSQPSGSGTPKGRR